MNEERENEQQGLGELPKSLFDERDSFPGNEQQAREFDPRNHTPPDILYQEQVSQQSRNASLLSPPYKEAVTSTHAVRPINARDFYQKRTVQLNLGLESQPTISVPYVVPAGFVAIMKQIRWSFDNPFAGTTRTDPNPNFPYINDSQSFFMRMKAENVIVQDYDNLIGEFINGTLTINNQVQGMPLSGSLNSYILADEDKEIELEFRMPTMLPVNFAGLSISPFCKLDIQFYGTLLLKRGLPVPFEPGSI